MKTRRNKLDIAFSQLIRERAGWTCESCGKYHPEGARRSLHCSHFFSRRNRSTRWDSQNAAAHCFACHQYLGENPLLFTDWVKAHLGQTGYELLRLRAGKPRKFSKPELEDMHQEMKAQLAHMEALRSSGEAGRIEFDLMMEVA